MDRGMRCWWAYLHRGSPEATGRGEGRGTPEGVVGGGVWSNRGVGLGLWAALGKSWGRLGSRGRRGVAGVSSSGEAPRPQEGLPLCDPFLLTLPCLLPCDPCWPQPPLRAEGHPCSAPRSCRSAPPCTSHPLRGAEGVVPSTPTRGQLPRSGRGKEAGANVREALEPSPVPFEFSRDDSSGEAPIPQEVSSLLLVPPHSPLPLPCTPCLRSNPCGP